MFNSIKRDGFRTIILILITILLIFITRTDISLSCKKSTGECIYGNKTIFQKEPKYTTFKLSDVKELKDIKKKRYSSRRRSSRTSHKYYIILNNNKELKINYNIYYGFSRYRMYPQADYISK